MYNIYIYICMYICRYVYMYVLTLTGDRGQGYIRYLVADS